MNDAILLLLFLGFLALVGNDDFLELEVVQIQLDDAIGKTGQVVGHALVFCRAMPPCGQVALHLVCRIVSQCITLFSGRHRLEFLKELAYELAVMAQVYLVLGQLHRLWLTS